METAIEPVMTVLPENLERALIIIPMVAWITQGLKQVLPKAVQKFTWVMSMWFGIGFAYLYVGAMERVLNTPAIILWGVLAGLAASGLYNVFKSTFRK